MHEAGARKFVVKRESVNLWGEIRRIKTVGIKLEKHDIEKRGGNRWNYPKKTGWTWEEITVDIQFERRKLDAEEWTIRGEISIEATGIDYNGTLRSK